MKAYFRASILAPAFSAVALLAACGGKSGDKAPAEGTPGTTAADAPHPGTVGGMSGMVMTGDPDRDFLRMMSDHHQGLIAMAHETMEAPRGTVASRADATALDTKQDEELRQMVVMLEKEYHDPYEPKALPQHKAMLDSLLTRSGAEYAKTFYRDVIAHHREGIVKIDAYLPTAKNAMLKGMAEKMKQNQAKEITELERKAAQP